MLHRIAALSALLAAAAAASAVSAEDAVAMRTLADRCLACHDADGPAPIRFDSIEAILRHRQLMRALVEDRTMPPAEAATTVATIDAAHTGRGALATDGRDALLAALASPDAARAAFATIAPAPPPRSPARDADIAALGAWTVPAAGGMQVRSFSAEIPPGAPRRVRGWRLVAAADPARSPIRFLALAPDPERLSRVLDDTGTGAESMGDVGLVPSGAFGALSRTAPDFVLPEGYVFDLPPGDLVLESTVEPIGREATIRPAIAWIAAGVGDARTVEAISARIVPLVVDAEERAERVVHLPIARDTRLVGVVAKGGVFLRGYAIDAVAGDGCRTPIARDADFRMNLAAPLVFRDPPLLAAGGVVEVRFDLDNTRSNPLQPFDPPRTVTAGLPPVGEDAAIVLLVSRDP